MNDRHKTEELEVFRAFAKKCPINIDFKSISKLEPPDLDIECVVDGKKVVFELVRIVDQNSKKNQKQASELENKFYEYYDRLSENERLSIDNAVSGSVVAIDYSDSCSFKQKIETIPFVFQKLSIIDKATNGDISIVGVNELEKFINWMSVERCNINSVSFQVLCGGVLGNPLLERVKYKLIHYSRSGDHELLVYYEQPHPPLNVWESNLDELIQKHIQSSTFYRVWVFSMLENKILYSYPKI